MENSILLNAIDASLTAIHFGVIFFVFLGWIFSYTRTYHLLINAIVVFQWGIAQYFYGFPRCLLTEAQWDIKHKLGDYSTSISFTGYYINKYLTQNVDPSDVSQWITRATIAMLGLSLFLNFVDILRESRRKKRSAVITS